MKLTQNDISTIEQMHDILLEKGIMDLKTDLLTSARCLSNGLVNKMDNIYDELFVLSKKEVYEIAYSRDSKESIKNIIPDLFNIEMNKWYYIKENSMHIFPVFKDYEAFFGYAIGEDYYTSDTMCYMRADSDLSNTAHLKRLFSNEIIRRKFTADTSDISFNETITSISCKGIIIFNDGKFIQSPLDLEAVEKQKKSNINNLVDKAKELEKKHGLKITVTFE